MLFKNYVICSLILSYRLAGCKISDKSCVFLAAVLQSANSLVELDLGNSDLGDSGVHLLSTGLCHLHYNLQTLRLVLELVGIIIIEIPTRAACGTA